MSHQPLPSDEIAVATVIVDPTDSGAAARKAAEKPTCKHSLSELAHILSQCGDAEKAPTSILFKSFFLVDTSVEQGSAAAVLCANCRMPVSAHSDGSSSGPKPSSEASKTGDSEQKKDEKPTEIASLTPSVYAARPYGVLELSEFEDAVTVDVDIEKALKKGQLPKLPEAVQTVGTLVLLVGFIVSQWVLFILSMVTGGDKEERSFHHTINLIRLLILLGYIVLLLLYLAYKAWDKRRIAAINKRLASQAPIVFNWRTREVLDDREALLDPRRINFAALKAIDGRSTQITADRTHHVLAVSYELEDGSKGHFEVHNGEMQRESPRPAWKEFLAKTLPTSERPLFEDQ